MDLANSAASVFLFWTRGEDYIEVNNWYYENILVRLGELARLSDST